MTQSKKKNLAESLATAKTKLRNIAVNYRFRKFYRLHSSVENNIKYTNNKVGKNLPAFLELQTRTQTKNTIIFDCIGQFIIYFRYIYLTACVSVLFILCYC